MSAIVAQIDDSGRSKKQCLSPHLPTPDGLREPRSGRPIRIIEDNIFWEGSYAGRSLDDNSMLANHCDGIFVFDSIKHFDTPAASSSGSGTSTKPATSASRLLSREDEAYLFRKLHFHYNLAAQFLQAAARCYGTVDHFRSARRHLDLASETRSHIAQCNLRLVVSIAKKYAAQTAGTFDELISHGNEGLLNALDQFDYRKGFRFSTYAYTAVQRAIFGGMRSETNRQKRFALNSSTDINSLTKDAAECDRREAEACIAANTVASLQRLLNPRESMIIQARFGFGSRPSPQSFREIGDEIGLSKQRVASIYHCAIDKLRAALCV